MKKVICVALVVCLICMLLTACGITRKEDADHAYVEITTSTGGSYIAEAFHGNNATYEMKRQECALKYATKINMADGETATIHFHCSQCGYDEVLEEVVAPYARLFACECNGTLEAGNMKEYIAVLIGNNANLDSTTDE